MLIENIKPEAAIELLRQGCTRGLSFFFREYCPLLSRFAVSILGDVKTTENVIAQVFIQLWKERETFKNDGDVNVFLYFSTRDECFKAIRESRAKRVGPTSKFYNGSVELLLHIMDAIEKADLKQKFNCLFEIKLEPAL